MDAWVPVNWIGLASLFGFGAMGLDKLLAAGRMSRISKRTLWLVALVGGFPGVMVGGYLFHHKTSKLGFWLPVVVAAVVWAAIIWTSLPLSGFRVP